MMAEETWAPALRGPPAISIHYYRNMSRASGDLIEFGLSFGLDD
ncbi:hypothetical protein [Roseobacter litoralis]|nr:hypothetical protein [Roseobacter litoralis]